MEQPTLISLKCSRDFFSPLQIFMTWAPQPVNSVIYKWKFGQFEKFQEIRTKAAIGSTAIVVNNKTLLVFANNKNTQSPVFKWSGERFVHLQSLKTHAAHDVKSLSISGDTFLAFANSHKEGNFNTDSFVYKWNGTRVRSFSLFQPVQLSPGIHLWYAVKPIWVWPTT